jgi:hypothetical protein
MTRNLLKEIIYKVVEERRLWFVAKKGDEINKSRSKQVGKSYKLNIDLVLKI